MMSMKGWVLAISFLLMAFLVSGATSDFDDCWGVRLCNEDYTCGMYDRICPDNFFDNESEPYLQGGCNKNYTAEGYAKCIDPDCEPACVEGSARHELTGEPVTGASIIYEQDAWNGTGWETITQETTTDGDGEYYLEVNPGNSIYMTADAPGFVGDVEGPLYNIKSMSVVGGCNNINFTLNNDSCTSSCTRMNSPYCDSECHMEGPSDNLCIFNTTTTFNGHTITSPMEACTSLGTQEGSIAVLGNYTDAEGKNMCVKVNCCGGDPYVQACPSPDIASTSENLIKITKIATHKGQPIKLRFYYWE